jgi:hypothetical protein
MHSHVDQSSSSWKDNRTKDLSSKGIITTKMKHMQQVFSPRALNDSREAKRNEKMQKVNSWQSLSD